MTNNSLFFKKNEIYLLFACTFKLNSFSCYFLKKNNMKAHISMFSPLLKGRKDFKPIKAYRLLSLFSPKLIKINSWKKSNSSTVSGSFFCNIKGSHFATLFYFLKFSWLPVMREKQLSYNPSLTTTGSFNFSVMDLHLVTIKYLIYDFFYYRKKLFINFSFIKKQHIPGIVCWSFWNIQLPFNK